MARPIVVSSVSWSTGSAANDVLLSVDVDANLASNNLWAEKIKGFLNYRGKAIFRVQVNANPFQQGRLLAHFIPFTSDLKNSSQVIATRNLNRTMKTQQPNVEIDCRDASGILEVPYISPSGYYDRDLQTFSWGTLYLSVLSPLATGSGGPTTAQITVWLSFEDFELSAPFHPQSSKGKKRSRPVKARVNPTDAEQESMGFFSSTLGAVASVADSLSDVPFISDIAKPVSWVADALSGVASFFGFSKPRNEQPANFVSIRNASTMTTFDGGNMAAPLSLSTRNKVEQMPGFAGSDLDEMSFNYLKKIPAYISEFQLSTSDVQGAATYNVDLYPLGLAVTGTTTVVGTPTDTYTYYTFPPFVYLANLFTLFRGSINLHFKFVKTQYHTGRVLITYVPKPSPTAPTVATSSYLLREVVDLRESQEITINFPYLKAFGYFSTAQAYGSVQVTVLNPLRAPETASSSIKCLVYASAGDDFELQGPKSTNFFATSDAINYPFVPQSEVKTADETVLTEKTIGDSVAPSLSVDQSKYIIGEHFASIKQLLTKYTRLGAATNITSTGTIWPWSVGMSRKNTTTGGPNPRVGNYGGDMYCYLAPGFALARGGMNMLVAGDQSSSVFASLIWTDGAAVPTTFPVISSTAPGSISNLSSPYNYANNDNLAPIQSFSKVGQSAEVFIPTYGRTPSRLIQWDIDTTVTTIPEDNSQPTTSLGLNMPTTGNLALFRATADDAQLGYFLGFPPILRTITSA